MMQGVEQDGAVTLVPAITTWQAWPVQVIGLPPSFFTDTDMAVGAGVPALREANKNYILLLYV